MTAFSIEIREATRADIRKCGAPAHLETSEDGTASVLVDGELVAVSDEYATAYLCPGTNAAPTKDVVEKFLAAGLEFYGEAT
jgi:hypothetical protein